MKTIRIWKRLLGQSALTVISVWMWVGKSEAASVCAQVSIEIKQAATLERQAFDAMMRIHNALVGVTLSNININVVFLDAEKNPVGATSNPHQTNALFFYRVDGMENITGVTNGVVAPEQVAEIHWLIIPVPGAGGTNGNGQIYYVGATLSYSARGVDETVEVEPDYIYVKPMPRLVLDYFLPGPVYGDDPFTQEIEEPIPFCLGLLARNRGAGPAHKLKLETAQPQIVDNRQGLLVGFEIVSGDVQGVQAGRNLLVDFGTLDPNSAKVARWIMTASLVGTFTNFTARFTHADTLGGELTSLMEAVNTHELVKDVLVDGPDRDRVYDFLAYAGSSLKVYESDNRETAVTDASGVSTLTYVEGSEGVHRWALDVGTTNAMLYVKKSFSAGASSEIQGAARADGKSLNLANVWISKTRVSAEQPWDYWLNLFDIEGGGHYELVFRDRPLQGNRPPVLAYMGPKVTREGEELGFLIEASDPDGTIPTFLAYGLPTGATISNAGPGQALFFWIPQTGQHGVYPVRFVASDGQAADWEIVRIYVGYANEPLCGGVPCSLQGWSVEISNLYASSVSGVATVMWQSVDGLLYEVYCSDDPFAATGNWVRIGTTRTGSGASLDETDLTLTPERPRRYYKVVLAGEPPDPEKMWAVFRREIPARSQALLAPAVRTDGRFNGAFGAALAEELTGNDGGIGSGADEVYVLQTNGTWRVLYLDGQKVWRESNGEVSQFELAAGQGFWLARRGGTNAVRVTFAGRVGNDGTRTNVLRQGWNLIGLSEGRDLKISEVFEGVAQGGATEETADQLILQTDDGRWRRLMYVEGWGAPYDGKWFDLSTYQVVSTNEVLRPGQAYYYLRRGGAVDLRF